ncbi:ABC transporter permease [Breznakiella homolactica]|uniref:ABC transporter permease n=1 Tax=Breznakiella homolactica TaxID=2798577 RepID=A0A7T7XJI5_9SPIR|nr:FtsX-like permease family protein [Breznakiella homolactica]QQO07450.1 FtsX-like permease family protein [Breznakiella homolactica]
MNNTFSALAGMAYRNLARHRVKTVITTIAVAVSVCLYIFVDAWLLGINLDSERNIVIYEIGAAKLQTRLYFEKKDDYPMYENFASWEPYAVALGEAGYDTAPRFVFTGTVFSAAGSAPMEFNAVDPGAEGRLLRYSGYMESGRYINPGAFEIALGSMAAEKLKVGIPQRPTQFELEGDILGYARNNGEEEFIRNLYEPASSRKSGGVSLFSAPDDYAGRNGNQRLVLKEDISRADLERFWEILDAGGRMDIKISTVIDLKAAPDTIRKERFDEDLCPKLSEAEQTLVLSAYGIDPITGDYYLVTDDEVLLGDILNAMVRVDYSGALRHVNQLIDIKVVGIINSPNPKTNANVGYLPLDVLQDEAGLMLDGHITELLIRSKKARDTALPGKSESPGVILASLESGLAARNLSLPRDLGVFGWREYAADYLAVSSADSVSTKIIIAMLFVLSFIGIANTMLMAILERTKEIGMMRALGMTDGDLVIAYMLEAGMIGFIGSVLGVTAGCLINIPMVAYGIDFSSMAQAIGGDFGYRITSYFRSAWNIRTIIGTGIIATVLSAAMAYFPTRRAIRMPVSESLRFE